MEATGLFTAALGLQAPWEVVDVRFEPQAGEIHFDVACSASRLPCPACGRPTSPSTTAGSGAGSTCTSSEYRAFIHAGIPRVACGACGRTTQVTVPRARPGSGFSLLFEAMALTLARSMPVARVGRLLGVGDRRLWRALTQRVEAARDRQSHAQVSHVGVDEKHVGRLGFISLFHDAGPAGRVLFGYPGRHAAVFGAFVEDLRAHAGQPAAARAVTMDLSAAYQAGARTHLPQAALCLDRFHLVRLANDALDQVGRAEVRTEPELKGLRWGTLKDPGRWTREQIHAMHWLTRSKCRTARAWRLTEALRTILAQAATAADLEVLLMGWVSWARRCRLKPFKRLGATIRDHLPGIVNAHRLGLSNATAESINASVQAAIARARGFRTFRHLMAIIYLTAGQLSHLPAAPCQSPALLRANA